MSHAKAARTGAPAIEEQLALLTAEVTRLAGEVRSMYRNQFLTDQLLDQEYEMGYAAGRASAGRPQLPRAARPRGQRGHLRLAGVAGES